MNLFDVGIRNAEILRSTAQRAGFIGSILALRDDRTCERYKDRIGSTRRMLPAGGHSRKPTMSHQRRGDLVFLSTF
ncbi:hypothetical protein ABIE89_000302 [Bradyrhizobium niftali]|uniref:hypothetical protein n=1 Tax=Bradyrhizobium niftali TaxID=2560055 RepID=UPI003834C233